MLLCNKVKDIEYIGYIQTFELRKFIFIYFWCSLLRNIVAYVYLIFFQWQLWHTVTIVAFSFN